MALNHAHRRRSCRDSAFANAVWVAPMVGANNGTAFFDNSPKKRAITAAGAAKTDTTTFPFYTASLNCGTGHIYADSSADFDFDTGDFCIEGWGYWTSTNTTWMCLTRRDAAADYSPVQILTIGGSPYNGQLYAFATSNGSSWNVVSFLGFGTPPTNTWAYFALTRSGNTFRTFSNFSSSATAALVSSTTSSAALWANGKRLRIGANGDNSNSFGGKIGPVRITKGAARYTASFATPKRMFEFA